MRFIGTESPINALEAMGQAVRTGDQAGFVAFTYDIEHGAPFLGTDMAGSEA
jgi:hypothetical protein